MTDKERDDMFEDKKRRVAIELTGVDPWSEEAKAASKEAWAPEVSVVDERWGKKDAKSWMERTRITDPMNNDIEGVNKFNFNGSDHRTSQVPDFWRGCKIAD